MLENLGIVLAPVCVLFGAVLLQDSLADPNANQDLRGCGGLVQATAHTRCTVVSRDGIGA
jgi:hypothetical protein